jgi:ABC-type spermidine/putrescine transport system permease subunit I
MVELAPRPFVGITDTLPNTASLVVILVLIALVLGKELASFRSNRPPTWRDRLLTLMIIPFAIVFIVMLVAWLVP